MNEAKIMIMIKKVRGDIVKFDEILRNMHTEGIIGVGLIIALFLAIYFNDRDLAVNIASGLIGYLGRGKVSS
ncbi:MAG: hypothetical protein SO022_03795 [Selenomonadaceae bacterium]|nr:hypothetical protein [Selenomonadaceae bacterium]